MNQQIVLQTIINALVDQFDRTRFYIDQPIVLSEIQSLIYSAQGVVSINDIQFKNMVGIVNGRAYSDSNIDVKNNIRRGILYPPEGGIFEFKYPEFDIVGRTAL